MNRQNDPSVFVSDELIDVFDLVITDEEADLLLAMDTPSRTRASVREVSPLPDDAFDAVFKSALEKGLVWMRHDEAGTETYAVAPILVGWFEAFLFNGRRTDAQREFARRVDDLFRYWRRFNVFPIRSLRNLAQRFSPPHQRVLPAAGKPRTRKIEINVPINAPPTGVLDSSGVVDLVDPFQRALTAQFAAQDVRQADDGVHRRANLVAHVGQEGTLGQTGLLGLLPGDLQFGRAAGNA